MNVTHDNPFRRRFQRGEARPVTLDRVDELSVFVSLRIDDVERLDDGVLLSWTVE
jgi:hypothetical protein